MRIQFVDVPNGPERNVCDAEIVFEEGDGFLAGMKLVGLSIWRASDGEIYMTFPSRGFGAGVDRKYFDYLRPVDNSHLSRSRETKATILAAWNEQGQPGKKPGVR